MDTSTDNARRHTLRTLNADGRYGAALLAILALVLALAATGERGRELLRYDRQGLALGQGWRLISAHLVHLGWEHTLLDCLGLILLWVLFARDYSPRRWLWIVTLSAAAIDAGLWYLEPAVQWYVGLSGVLHGVLAAGAWAMCRRRERLGFGLLALLAVKLFLERHSAASLLVSDLPIVPSAHLFGALGGLAGALLL